MGVVLCVSPPINCFFITIVMSHEKHIFLPLSSSTEAEIVSLQVVVGERVRKGSLLCSYKIGNEPNQSIKCSLVGFVREVMVKEGDVIRQG